MTGVRFFADRASYFSENHALMNSLQPTRHCDPEVNDRLRAFSLFWRCGWEMAISRYPGQANFLLLHLDKTFEEVLRACFPGANKSKDCSPS